MGCRFGEAGMSLGLLMARLQPRRSRLMELEPKFRKGKRDVGTIVGDLGD